MPYFLSNFTFKYNWPHKRRGLSIQFVFQSKSALNGKDSNSSGHPIHFILFFILLLPIPRYYSYTCKQHQSKLCIVRLLFQSKLKREERKGGFILQFYTNISVFNSKHHDNAPQLEAKASEISLSLVLFMQMILHFW